MKLISLQEIGNSLKNVLRRFPFAMLTALVGTAMAYLLVHDRSYHDEWWIYRILMTCLLGFLLFIAIRLFYERSGWPASGGLFLKGAVLIFLAIYYLLLPDNFDYAHAEFVIRSVLLGVAFLFSVTFTPFINHWDEVNGFWQHNKNLFLRLFFTGVYTGVLYLGLVLALFSMETLLEFDFQSRIYAELWVIIVGLVATAFFLGGVPEKTADLQKVSNYQQGIRIFAQYILTPLLIIYALILYSYTGKIIINWDWPEGMVSWLIIVFSIGSFLTYFLLYPIQKKEKWVFWFLKAVNFLILPMMVVFFLALKIRIDEYGLTEARYYGLILNVWLTGIALYFLVSKKKNLITIPVSIFIIVLLSTFGPWSAISLSEANQVNRMREALERNGMLVNDTVKKVQKEIPFEDRAIISSSLDYLRRYHGYSSINPWFPQDLEALFRERQCYSASCVADLMGVDYLNPYQRRQGSASGLEPRSISSASAELQGKPALDISGFSSLYEFNLWTSHLSASSGLSEGGLLNQVMLQGNILTFKGKGDAVIFDLSQLIAEMKHKENVRRSLKEMTVEQDGNRLIIERVQLQKDPSTDERRIGNIIGYLLTP
jgi:hypothetical protein